ncbi:MAG TPA: hypothetical protein VMT88_13500 [Actinomycetes bacterium]|nr:hypothetical protein [Actinomycetes bacterium]
MADELEARPHRSTSIAWVVVGLIALVSIVVGAGWWILQPDGQVDGDAATPEAFLASLPSDWNCQTYMDPVEGIANAKCPGVGAYHWFVTKESADSDTTVKREGHVAGCVVLSGRTVATTLLGIGATGEVTYGNADKLISSFKGSTETLGTDC